MIVGLDLDGVCYSFVDAHRDYLVARGPHLREDLPDPTRWQVWECWGMSQSYWRSTFDSGVACGRVFGGGHRYAYPGAVDSILQLDVAGHEVLFVTNREPSTRGATRGWLNQVGLGLFVEGLIFTPDKAAVEMDVLVEDNVDNAVAVARAGTPVALFDRPWNRRWRMADGSEVDVDRYLDDEGLEVERCRSWGEVLDYVRRIERLHKAAAPFAPRRVVAPGEVRVTSETGGQKGSKPQQVAQIPPHFLLKLGEVYAFGAEKYPDAEPGRPNWSRGYAWSLSYNALQRHLAAAWGGEWIDPEDGLPHIVKVAWHAGTLFTFEELGLGVDDRPAYYRDAESA